MQLLMTQGSPFARKVRILARELGLANRIDEVIVKVSPVEANPELARSNPLAQIPVLLSDDGMTLYDSAVICEYLESLGAWDRTMPSSGPARWTALRSQALCDGMLNAAILCRYEAAARPAPLRWDAWSEGQQRKIAAGLTELDAQCAGWQDAFDMTQIGAVCVLGYVDFRFSDWAWRDGHPRLARWFSHIANRASVLETVPAG